MITNYTGVSGSRTAYLIAAQMKQKNKGLVVVSTGRAAERMARDLGFYLPDSEIIVLQEEHDIQVLYEASSREALIRRLQGIQALSGQYAGDRAGTSVVIAPVSAAVRLTVSPERFLNTCLKIETGMVMEPSDLRRKLAAAGYNASPVTESPGEFTARGGILDVFPPALQHPVRIEFWGDEIDSIREFDQDTQRSLTNISSAVIGPAAEFIPTEEEKSAALVRIRREYDKRIRRVRNEYAAEFSAESEELESSAAELEEKLDDFRGRAVRDGRIESLTAHKGRVTDLFEQSGNTQIFADFLQYFDAPEYRLWDIAADMGAGIFLSDPARAEDELPESASPEDFYGVYTAGSGSVKPDITICTPFPERISGLDRPDSIVNVCSRQVAPFNGQIDLFAQETGKLADLGYAITIIGSSAERNERIKEYLDIADVEGNITYRVGELSSGFIMDDEKVCFITESDIYPESRRQTRKPKARKKSSDTISFSDLHEGDYVVHEIHGIGRFEGIRPVTADGQTRDYLVIRYAGSDVLYIPTEQLDIIQKYIGNSGNTPALSRLAGGSWKRTREKARKAAMEIAEDLVRLYAERQAAGGHAFGKDTLWQAEFESDFPYTETEDQLRAVEEIKEDMEQPLPMDRLLCGDVGYGKTEVAARAIFKCVSEGKQAALLAPTTLLVNQHFHNLKERFANFPFEIQELSRFRSSQAQKRTIEQLRNGSVDLIIGTHRLLSNDVGFKDLGLLVIDEEQRFGVRHKEKIKELRRSIDVLTLSATPIPRTLNMSLTGIKDISLIDEPPGDRLPVHTYVTPYEEEILRNAIERELARGGQVFIVNNRITGLNQIRDTVERLVPHAVIATGHGRMSEETLENTMLDFIEGRINVLIATTIIENGIDIPNANTMIIMNADRFGLAQLYQLRGRVGRSSRLAYTYLMYQPGKVLTEIARKRLTAIREFTEFGAGFKVAMRDLELRGAGNMLGEAQSGHIESIGYELYCKEIDRAVRMLKGEVVTEQRSDISIELPVQASIPASYITDETLRLQAYKKMAAISSAEDADDLTDELLDRYGDVPEETMALLKVAEIRAHAEVIGVTSVTRRMAGSVPGNGRPPATAVRHKADTLENSRVLIKFAETNRLSAYALVMAKAEFGADLSIMSGRTSMIDFHLRPEGGSAAKTAASRVSGLDKLLALMRLLRDAADNPPGGQE